MGRRVAALSAVVIFGGIKQIARVAELVVPFMSVIIDIGEVPGLSGKIDSTIWARES